LSPFLRHSLIRVNPRNAVHAITASNEGDTGMQQGKCQIAATETNRLQGPCYCNYTERTGNQPTTTLPLGNLVGQGTGPKRGYGAGRSGAS